MRGLRSTATVVVVLAWCLFALLPADATQVRTAASALQAPATTSPAAAPAPAPTTPAPKKPAWNYKSGGGDWGGSCSDADQSPIDIANPVGEGGMDSEELNVYYPVVSGWDVGLKIKHTGRAIELMANMPHALGYATFNSRRYSVKRVVFRSPSEHTLRGVRYPMEMQIIHQRDGKAGQDDLYVISALFQVGNFSNVFLEKRLGWNSLPKEKGSRQLIDGPFRLGEAIVGLHQGYYQYYGSATVPPCTTGAVWNVMEPIQTMSADQLQIIQYFFEGNQQFALGRGNNRDVQSLGSRSVVLHNHKMRGDGDGLPPGIPDAILKSDSRRLDSKLEVDPEGVNKFLTPNRSELVPRKYWFGGDDWTGRCRYGRTQSPINIVLSAGNPHGDYSFDSAYESVKGVLIENTGETFRLIGNFGRVMIEKVIYDAYEITFHAPAEHMIDGRQPHLEMQIIHKRRKPNNRRLADPRDDFVIVSVLFVENQARASKFLDSLGWDALPGKGTTREVTDAVNLYHLLGMENNAGGYYSYAGSLSKPPCAEAVKRFVMRRYQDISPLQLTRFRVYYLGNNRKIQELNNRGVALHNVNAHTDMEQSEPRQTLADGSLIPTPSSN